MTHIDRRADAQHQCGNLAQHEPHCGVRRSKLPPNVFKSYVGLTLDTASVLICVKGHCTKSLRSRRVTSREGGHMRSMTIGAIRRGAKTAIGDFYRAPMSRRPRPPARKVECSLTLA
jgi:hypothetical protein